MSVPYVPKKFPLSRENNISLIAKCYRTLFWLLIRVYSHPNNFLSFLLFPVFFKIALVMKAPWITRTLLATASAMLLMDGDGDRSLSFLCTFLPF